MTKADGTIATATDLKSPAQNLNLWTGVAESNFILGRRSRKSHYYLRPG